jgi:hypothetical protein
MFILFVLLGAMDVTGGTTPVVDGNIEAGEWNDALSISLSGGNFWVKHDGTRVFFAVKINDNTFHSNDNFTFCFDPNNSKDSAPQSDDFASHIRREPSSEEWRGNGSTWDIVDISGWSYSLSSTNDYWQVEYKVEYSKLGITAGEAKTIGFCLAINDMDDTYTTTYPGGAFDGNPSTWENMASSDNWQKVGVEEGKTIIELKLFPNSVNPERIEYSLSQRKWVRLAMYDITGILKQVLVNSMNEVGKHSIEIRSHSLPCGIYFLNLKADKDITICKKILFFETE